MNLAEAVLSGNRLALSRLLTQVENDTPLGREGLDQLIRQGGRAHWIGVTGSPGMGKSTLVNRLVRTFRLTQVDEKPRRVAILAVDPTSPFSGGALLGDRVRMRELAGDPQVFIRSVATRGALGGLSRAVPAMCQVLDAAGFDLLFIETVGVGQAEIDIANLAHTTLVVLNPGTGDEVQSLKAGLLEIADIFVINKADRPGADALESMLRALVGSYPGTMSSFAHHHDPDRMPVDDESIPWRPPIFRTNALTGEGILDLGRSILAHRQALQKSQQWDHIERQRLQNSFETQLLRELRDWLDSRITPQEMDLWRQRIFSHEITPIEAIRKIMEEVRRV